MTKVKDFQVAPVPNFRCCDQPMLNAAVVFHKVPLVDMGPAFNFLASSMCSDPSVVLTGEHPMGTEENENSTSAPFDSISPARHIDKESGLANACIMHLTRGILGTSTLSRSATSFLPLAQSSLSVGFLRAKFRCWYNLLTCPCAS